jgi:lysophospholipase L1-like esterase
MWRAIASVAFAALAVPALAAELVARTADATPLRPSMGQAAPIASIPPGAELKVEICFSAGKWCAVTYQGQQGFVAGAAIVLDIDGKSINAAEAQAKDWAAAVAKLPTPALDDSSDIAAWGDSLTAGAGADVGDGYTDQARSLLGGTRLIANMGIGGQTSSSIAARMDAIGILLTLADDTIPDGGSAEVVDRTALPLTNQGASTLSGTLCGVAGTLAVSAKAGPNQPVPPYVFTPDQAGQVVACPSRSRFVPADAVALRNRVAWLWLGRNGADKGRTIAGDIEAAVASLGHQRYLVGSVLAARLDDGPPALRIFELNAALKRSYGSRFVDVLGALVAAASESAEDQADARQGFVPRSLLSDSIHLNQKGYAIVARAFVAAMNANGL